MANKNTNNVDNKSTPNKTTTDTKQSTTDTKNSVAEDKAKSSTTSYEPNSITERKVDNIVGMQSSTATGKVAQQNSGMSDAVFGFVVLAILVSLIIWAVVSVVGNSSDIYTLGQLDYPTSSRVGQSVVLTYDIDSIIDNHTSIEWYVDDVRVDSTSYAGDNKLQYQWQPTDTGKHTVQLKIGNSYTDKAELTVDKPLVVVDIDDITVQYGDELPELTYTVSGLMGSDNWQSMGCSGRVQCTDNIAGVGIYTLDMSSKKCTNDNYELQCNTGNLVVVPRKLTISNNIIKQYDGTNSMSIGTLELSGVLEGDKVQAVADTLYFSDKNVGESKQISTYNIMLQGDSSSNYTLEGSTVSGEIVPKKLSLEGVVVDNKVFDGNTVASISDSGKLVGVQDGDIVAIGYMMHTIPQPK